MNAPIQPPRLLARPRSRRFAALLAGLLLTTSAASPRADPPADGALIHYSEGTREEALAKARRLGWTVVYDNDRGRFLVCKPPPVDKTRVPALMLGNEEDVAKVDRTPAERLPSLAIPPGGGAGIRMSPTAIVHLLEPLQLLGGRPIQPPKDVLVDRYRHRLWGLDGVHAPDPPDAKPDKADPPPLIVAIIDTGVDYDHEDLKPVLWVNPGEGPVPDGVDDDHNGIIDDIHGADFTQRNAAGYPVPTGEPMDDHGHGTHVAGTVAAARYNGLGIAGVAPRVRIMALKVLNSRGVFTADAASDALDYAIKNGARVVNCSWIVTDPRPGTDPRPPFVLSQAIAKAAEAGVLLVVAAGNQANAVDQGADIDHVTHFPASIDSPNVLAVMAVGPDSKPSRYSNYGRSRVRLAAPGGAGGKPDDDDILSTLPGNLYGYSFGTSMATPHVTAAAASVLWADPTLKVDEVGELLVMTAERMASLEGRCVAGGVVHFENAIRVAALNRKIRSGRLLTVFYKDQGRDELGRLLGGLGLDVSDNPPAKCYRCRVPDRVEWRVGSLLKILGHFACRSAEAPSTIGVEGSR